jgi:hypothetical protein
MFEKFDLKRGEIIKQKFFVASLLLLFIVMISAGSAFAADDGAVAADDLFSADAVADVSSDVTDESVDDSADPIATNLYGANTTMSRASVMEGNESYTLYLGTNGTIPLPLANKTIKVIFDTDDVKEYTTSWAGIVNVPIPAETPIGTYYMYVTFDGDEKYATCSAIKEIVIEDTQTQIISLGSKSYGRDSVKNGSATVPILLTTNTTIPKLLANKTVYISMYNAEPEAYNTSSLGLVNYVIPYTPVADNYTIDIVFPEEDGYLGSSLSVDVEIKDVETRVYALRNVTFSYTDLLNNKTYYPALLTTNDTIPKLLANKTVIVEFDGVGGEFITNSLGLVNYHFYTVPVGNYSVIVRYYGEDCYLPSEHVGNLEVTKGETQIKAEDVTVDYADPEGKLVGTLTNDYDTPLQNVNIVVNINGVDYAVKTNSKGQFEVSLADLSSGNYTATITYKGNKRYDATNATAAVTVNKLETSIYAVYDDENDQIVATVTNSQGKPVVNANIYFDVAGAVNVIKTNSKGQAKLSTASLEKGLYEAVITYRGNKKYSPADAEIAFNTANTFIIASDVVVKCGDAEGKFVATLQNATSGKGLINANVIVNIGGVDYALKTNSKGQVEVSTADLAPGNYSVTVTYKGNSKYDAFTTTANLEVSKMTLAIKGVYTGGNKTLTVYLTNADTGKAIANAKVVVHINGTNQTLKTNGKGEARLSTEDLPLGLYYVTYAYNGNSKYEAVSAWTLIFVM